MPLLGCASTLAGPDGLPLVHCLRAKDPGRALACGAVLKMGDVAKEAGDE
jgi:hypothetical protein